MIRIHPQYLVQSAHSPINFSQNLVEGGFGCHYVENQRLSLSSSMAECYAILVGCQSLLELVSLELFRCLNQPRSTLSSFCFSTLIF